MTKQKTNLIKFWEKCYYVDKPDMKYPPTILERLTRAKQFIDLTELEEIIWDKYILCEDKSINDILVDIGIGSSTLSNKLFNMSLKFTVDEVIRIIWLRKPTSKIPRSIMERWISGDVGIRNLDMSNHYRYKCYNAGILKISDIDKDFLVQFPKIFTNCGKPTDLESLVRQWYDRMYRVLDVIGVE